MSSRDVWVLRVGVVLIGAFASVAAAQNCQTDVDCDDSRLCTLDQCLFNTCVNTHRDSVCDDGLFCNGQEPCDSASDTCQPGTDVTCDPGLHCSERAGRCLQCDFDTDCEKICCCSGTVSCPQGGGLCFCGGNLCGVEPSCVDGDLCTVDICVAGECPAPPNYSVSTECCDPATGDTVPLDDGDDCTDDVCDTETGDVSHPFASCDDGDTCTVDDRCVEGGGCVGSDVNSIACATDADCPLGVCQPSIGFCGCTPCAADSHCNDGHACTTDTCDVPSGVCLFETDDNACATGLFCSVEVCSPGLGCTPADHCTPRLGNPCPNPSDCSNGTGNCGGCKTPAVVVAGCRYLDITPGTQGTTEIAIVVTGDCKDPSVACLSKFVDLDDPSNVVDPGVASLVDAPVYRRRGEWGLIHLRDSLIKPGSDYRIYTECNFSGAMIRSAGTAVRTWKWGDTNDQGDALVDFVDIARAVDGFTATFGGGNPPLTFEMVDVVGTGESFCTPNRDINFVDISAVVNAFTGGPLNCDDPCP